MTAKSGGLMKPQFADKVNKATDPLSPRKKDAKAGKLGGPNIRKLIKGAHTRE